LHAALFSATVLIHWRIMDAIPLVACAAFPGLFVIITYATPVTVRVSGMLIIKFTGIKDAARADRVYYGSVRIIPPLSILLNIVLFTAILMEGVSVDLCF
jgi:hypothetical protein